MSIIQAVITMMVVGTVLGGAAFCLYRLLKGKDGCGGGCSGCPSDGCRK